MTLHTKNHPISTIKKSCSGQALAKSALPYPVTSDSWWTQSKQSRSHKSIDNLRCRRRTNHHSTQFHQLTTSLTLQPLHCVPLSTSFSWFPLETVERGATPPTPNTLQSNCDQGTCLEIAEAFSFRTSLRCLPLGFRFRYLGNISFRYFAFEENTP